MQSSDEMISYKGIHCGCCGKWVNRPFSIPTSRSEGEWCDTWGLCPKCKELGETNERTRIRMGFRGKHQRALFVLWKEYLYGNRVVYAKVIFKIGKENERCNRK